MPTAPQGSDSGLYVSFWNQLLEKTRLQTSLFRGAAPKAGAELTVKQGALRWSFVVSDNASLVALQVGDTDANRVISERLLAHQHEIDLACGARLIWRQGHAADEPALVVIWRVEEYGPATTGDWTGLQDALVDAMARLYGACRPYLTEKPGQPAPARPAPDADIEGLAQRFTEDLINAHYLLGEETGYSAAQFLGSVRRHGGVDAARRSLRVSQPEGLETLRKMHRLDISVEAYVLRPEYAALFTEDEREIARARLRSCGYPV